MKAIAVFDIENDRIFDYSCDLHVWNEFGDVRLVKKDALLRPLPQKKDIDKTLEFGGYENIIQESLARGYNACLDEITGETE